jgi:GT2 family glycosyltransferase
VDVSIVIVSYNTRHLLNLCLESIYKTAGSLEVETIVVDNSSRDGSVEMVRQLFPQVVIIENSNNSGFAAACNQGIEISKGRYILLLNSDAELLEGTLQTMVSFMDEHPKVGITGTQLFNADGTFQGSYADFPSLWGEFLLLTKLSKLFRPDCFPSYPASQSQAIRPVDWVFGACMLARKSTIDAIGLMDESYFMYTEETDWCFRVHKGGFDIYYLPEARVLHKSGQSAATEPEFKRSQIYRSKWLFFTKHRSKIEAKTLYTAIKIASILKLVAWAFVGLTGGRRQQKAKQHIQSYRKLLRTF